MTVVPDPWLHAIAAAVGVLALAAAVPAGSRQLRARSVGPPAATPASRLPGVVCRALDRAAVPAHQHVVLVRWWLTGLVATVLATPLVPGAAVVAVLATVGPPVAVLVARDRAARHRDRGLPAALEAAAAGMRSGLSPTQALCHLDTTAGAARAELAAVGRRSASGTPLVDAVERWACQHPDASTRLVAAALATAADAGGPGADALHAAAASLRDRAGVDDEIAALSVQARTSAALLTVTPIGFTVLLAGLDPASARFLLGTGVGWACLGGGLALDVAGALWMRRLVANAR